MVASVEDNSARLRELCSQKLSQRRLILASNRGPIEYHLNQDEQLQAQRQDEITPEDLERILAAIEASDKNTQEEMLRKASKRRTLTGKDW